MKKTNDRVEFSAYQSPESNFPHLSLKDLLEARELYHIHLMRHPNVLATAVGRYRIRMDDSYPYEARQRHGTGPRRLDNSEVRSYSWPCILVFVETWADPKEFADHPGYLVPKSLALPDGRSVPVCVIEAPQESETETRAPTIRYPVNNIGPGHPLVAEVQGHRYAATIGCLVSDGHRVYALTNRHVTGDAGEPVYTLINGQAERIGESAAKQITKRRFTEIYPSLPGKDTFVNLDIGLVDIDDLDRWTAKVRDVGVVGPMVDFSDSSLSLSLIGCHVRGIGAAGGDMRGEIYGLFYRYNRVGGFEYVADLFIGPRTIPHGMRKAREPAVVTFNTLPGDSGTLWMLEPTHPEAPTSETLRRKRTMASIDKEYRPLAVQWGRHMFKSADKAHARGYVLATLLSRVCALLEVDPVRDWNLDQSDTWGAIGHFSVARHTLDALSGKFKKLSKLMDNNADLISPSDDVIKSQDFKGMGSKQVVPLADVPDFYWKPRIAKQGHTRPSEGPNHFADMDQPNDEGETLLTLSQDPAFNEPDKWNAFYSSIKDLLKDTPISKNHRGLLPFRVWQIFDAMVGFARKGKHEEFVCAAGVLTHYIGDACQPLHISYLHDGDPERAFEYVFKKGKNEGKSEMRPLGKGVHTAYEDTMIADHREAILTALADVEKVKTNELISTGKEAAELTIAMMRRVFEKVPPKEIVDVYVNATADKSAVLWKKFGTRTKAVMQEGTHLLAVLWESAWATGDGESNVDSTDEIDPERAMEIVAKDDFLPSTTIDEIESHLKG